MDYSILYLGILKAYKMPLNFYALSHIRKKVIIYPLVISNF
jgi:hypothetical protein